ncbi:MAG: hypothetical protein LBF88_04865 [Planctomycetaceae bacterium]|jgi:hypothetical protein|nr:hypothetical protein [Planctomycetaceae bacterium]
MITLLKNLWVIGMKLPALIAILKSIIDVIGSEQVKRILEAIRDAVRGESVIPIPETPQTEAQRLRIVQRLRQRLALSWLNMTESEYTAYCRIKNDTVIDC